MATLRSEHLQDAKVESRRRLLAMTAAMVCEGRRLIGQGATGEQQTMLTRIDDVLGAGRKLKTLPGRRSAPRKGFGQGGRR